uniref:Uncharacterized protein n=1 Tax=Romanomermis culicivorax TaxID=13658 RepID=A0A915KCG3_ROMCU
LFTSFVTALVAKIYAFLDINPGNVIAFVSGLSTPATIVEALLGIQMEPRHMSPPSSNSCIEPSLYAKLYLNDWTHETYV